MANNTFCQDFLTVISTNKNLSNDDIAINKEVFNLVKNMKTLIRKNASNMEEGIIIYQTEKSKYPIPTFCSVEHGETKWEKFCKIKGIKKRKRSRRVWCEETQQWEFKYGSSSVKNQKMRSGVVEIDEEEGKVGSLSKMRRDKQKRVMKNRKNQIANAQRKFKK